MYVIFKSYVNKKKVKLYYLNTQKIVSIHINMIILIIEKINNNNNNINKFSQQIN